MTETLDCRHTARSIVTAVALLVPTLCHAADPPAWLQDVARMASAYTEPGADAVVLHDELNVAVSADGRVVTRRMYAVRVLTKDGASAASIREVYLTGGGEVRRIRAWMLADGRSTQLGKPETADVALVDNDVYNEVRVRVISGASQAGPGTVFGGETETVERTVFAQFEWPLQGRWPVRRVRRTLTLPAGWDARSITLNRAPIEPVREGNAFVWTASELPAPPDEPAGPALSSLVARVAVTYFGQPRSGAAFEDWASVSRWLAALQDPQAGASVALTAKARELTATASTDLERIRAVAGYVQKIQYISIQTGIGRGGGYKPHPASEVLQKNYGDCKDKANLMRALLASVGIRSYLVGIYAGDPGYVRREWPSPQQFNHVIIAVSVPPDIRLPAAADNGNTGKLLFFDPTDAQTPIGELPLHLQDSLGLIVTPENGVLLRLPATSPDAHPRVRHVQAAVTSEGTLTATIRETTAGDPASAERYWFQSLSKDDYLRRLESGIRRQVPGAILTLGRVGDDAATNRFELTLQLRAAGFAQVLRDGLLLIRAPQAIGVDLPLLPRAIRTSAIVLEPREEHDRFELELPPGTAVDELPPARAIDAPFGRFSVRWSVDNGRVVRSACLSVWRAVLPASDYDELRLFIEAFRDAEGLPVVLARRP